MWKPDETCVKCEKTDYPPQARGLCSNCYHLWYRSTEEGKAAVRRAHQRYEEKRRLRLQLLEKLEAELAEE